jgi:hypothetical protein
MHTPKKVVKIHTKPGSIPNSQFCSDLNGDLCSNLNEKCFRLNLKKKWDFYKHYELLTKTLNDPPLSTKVKDEILPLFLDNWKDYARNPSPGKKIWSLEFNSYKEYLEKYGNPMSDKAIVTIASYYDGLGFLLYKRLITDIDIIEYFTEGAIIQIWEKLKPIIVGMRKATNSPELFKSLEYLYKETKKT